MSKLGLASAAEPFVEHLQSWLTQVAQTVDQICKDGTQLTINEAGEPVLKHLTASQPPEGAQALEAAILQRLPERSVLDVLCNVEHWLHWVRHFGPVSGSEPKLDHPTERYVLTVFGYGCNLGPNQTARHTRGQVSARMLAHAKRQHISTQQSDTPSKAGGLMSVPAPRAGVLAEGVCESIRSVHFGQPLPVLGYNGAQPPLQSQPWKRHSPVPRNSPPQNCVVCL